jgi:hypothetical protein
MNTSIEKAPWHLWLVGILSLLWNAFGCYDYTMTQLRDRAYIEAAMAPMGLTYEESMAFFDSFPAFASALWALGVWGSLAGAILLLIRSRHAVTAFLLSLIGALGSFAYQFSMEMPAAMAESSMARVMPLVIIVLVILQWWYARRQAAAGVLR